MTPTKVGGERERGPMKITGAVLIFYMLCMGFLIKSGTKYLSEGN